MALLAIDSTMLFGNTWVMKSRRFSAPVLSCVAVPASGSGIDMELPGWVRLAISRPSVSEISEAPMNQASARVPIRPTVRESPMVDMPAARVANTRGAMIILIMRRKISVSRPK